MATHEVQLTYTPQAEREFKQIWKSAANVAVIAGAMSRLENALAHDPFAATTDFGERASCILVWPLAALFTVDESRTEVYISHVYQLDAVELN